MVTLFPGEIVPPGHPKPITGGNADWLESPYDQFNLNTNNYYHFPGVVIFCLFFNYLYLF